MESVFISLAWLQSQTVVALVSKINKMIQLEPHVYVDEDLTTDPYRTSHVQFDTWKVVWLFYIGFNYERQTIYMFRVQSNYKESFTLQNNKEHL